MRVEEKIEQFGTFWIPENPDKTIAGKLIVEDGAYITVELYDILGNLKVWDNESSNISKINGAIYGYKSQPTTKIALDECQLTRIEGTTTGNMSILAHRLIVGEEHRENEDILLNKMSFSFEGIIGWVNRNLTPDDVSKYLTYKSTAEAEVIYNDIIEIPDIYEGGISVDFFFGASVKNQLGIKIEIKRAITLNISFKQPISLRNAEIILNDLAVFFSIATSETANIKNVNFSNSTEVDNKRESLMELYHKGIIFSKNVSPAISRKVLLSVKHIKEKDDSMLKKWLEGSSRTHTAFRAYSLYKLNEEGNFIDRFLALTQAIEILHTAKIEKREENKHSKRCANDSPDFRCGRFNIALKCRIQYLIEEFQESLSDVIDEGAVDEIAVRIGQTRNYYIHYPESGQEKRFNMEDKSSFHEAVNAMKLMEGIFQCAFLSEVGFSNSEIKGMLK